MKNAFKHSTKLKFRIDLFSVAEMLKPFEANFRRGRGRGRSAIRQNKLSELVSGATLYKQRLAIRWRGKRRRKSGHHGFLTHRRDEEQLEERTLIEGRENSSRMSSRSSSTSFFSRERGPEISLRSLVTSFFFHFTRGVRKILSYL